MEAVQLLDDVKVSMTLSYVETASLTMSQIRAVLRGIAYVSIYMAIL